MPTAPPARYRAPMTATPARPPLPDYDDALDALLGAVTAPLPGASESAPLDAAAGRVLADDLCADRDLPPFDRSAMDGYAVRASEIRVGRTFAVHGDAPAGAPEIEAGPPGTCVRIATGAPVPSGLDAVVPHERTDRGDPVRIESGETSAGDAVHPRGADARSGDVLAPAGTRIGPAIVGLAATVGREQLDVRPRPRVAILTTGDEVRSPSESVAPHQIRNSNGPMLAALARDAGAEVALVTHAADDPDRTVAAVRESIASAEVVLTVGGISAGERDHVAGAVADAGGRLVLRGAAIQPGRPITGAIVDPDGTVVIALPGNPVSALACFTLFAAPLLARLSGSERPAWTTIPLAAPVRPNPRRTAFRPARLESGGAAVPTWQGSGDLAHTAGTAGLVRLPRTADTLDAGTLLPFMPWPGGAR